MRIDSSGNVGIGMAADDARLQVGGNVFIGSAANNATIDNNLTTGGLDVAVGNGTKAFQVWDDSETGTPRFIVERTGKVGIGTDNPSQPLSVAGNGMLQANQGYMYLSNVGTGNAGIYVRGTGTANELRNHSTGIHTWEITGSEKMRIDSEGNLGIGDINVDTRLHVKGGNTAGRGQIYVQSNGTTVNPRAVFANSADTYGLDLFADMTNSFAVYDSGIGFGHKFTVNGTEHMRITAGGSIWHKEKSNNGDYTSYIGSISNVSAGNRYLHVQIDTDSGDMVWIEVEGYDYSSRTMNGRSGCYIYSSNAQPYSRAQSGSIVKQWQNANKLELVLDTGSGSGTNRWGSMVFRGGTDTITSSTPMSIIQWEWTDVTDQSWT